MEQKILEMAAAAIRVPVEQVGDNQKEVPEINGWYVWDPKRGGLAVLINADGEKLAATSSISFERHLEAFKGGRRN